MNDDEYATFQWYLFNNPEKGDLIPRSGGLRKIRWHGKGKGKRGGFRIIYYYKSNNGEIWLLTIYAKNEIDNISDHMLKEFRKEIDHE